MNSDAPAILYDGPANTGKTRSVLEKVRWFCEEFPGCRVLLCRKTKASLAESVLAIWESEVLSPQDRLFVGRKSASHRDSYTFPNGSHVVLSGLDDVRRIMSAQYALIVIFEATEATLNDFEMLTTRMRRGNAPIKQIVLDCNPGMDTHWAIQRHYAGKLQRILSVHEDNPLLFDHELGPDGLWDGVSGSWTEEGVRYLGILDDLTGARLERLRKGIWCSEEGVVYDEWSDAVHLIDYPLDEQGEHTLKPLRLRWFFASGDWGLRAPGTLQVWGVDAEKRMYLVAEVYRQGQQQDWWAERLCELDREFHLKACVYDPSAPAVIELMNRQLGALRGRETGRIVVGAENEIKSGISLVKFALTGRSPDSIATGTAVPGGPLLYVLRDSLRYGRDPVLAAAGQPCCFAQEISGFVWEKASDGRILKKERPDPARPDHGCDSARYAVQYWFVRNFAGLARKEPLQPGSIGFLLGKKWTDE